MERQQKNHLMNERQLGYQIRETDAIVEPDVYRDAGEDPIAIAADGFARFLEKLHEGSRTPGQFVVRGYAALWHMRPAAFGGKTQREVAKMAGVTPEHFNTAVRSWAVMLGQIGAGMRPRDNIKRAVMKGLR